MNKVLVVGAGFSGAVIARTLADAGLEVDVIDRMNHVAGNAYDFVNNNSERIHKYGPHILHGSSSSFAIKWISLFTEWIPYKHKVRALLDDGTTTPIPINSSTIEHIFKKKFTCEEDVRSFMKGKQRVLNIKTADDVFLSSVGKELADIFFRPYTKKNVGYRTKKSICWYRFKITDKD